MLGSGNWELAENGVLVFVLRLLVRTVLSIRAKSAVPARTALVVGDR